MFGSRGRNSAIRWNREAFLMLSGPKPVTLIGATTMHGLIYLIGVIVVIMAILSFFGLR